MIFTNDLEVLKDFSAILCAKNLILSRNSSGIEILKEKSAAFRKPWLILAENHSEIAALGPSRIEQQIYFYTRENLLEWYKANGQEIKRNINMFEGLAGFYSRRNNFFGKEVKIVN